MPGLECGWRARREPLGNFGLQLDPTLRAAMLAFDAPRLRDLLLSPPWTQFRQDALDSVLRQPVPAARPAPVPRGDGPAVPRAGQAADLLQAIWKIPAVQHAASQVSDGVTRELRRPFSQASMAGRVLLASWTGVIAGSAMAAVLSDGTARALALRALAGKDVPVPGVAGLTLRLEPNGAGATFRDLGGSGVSVQGHLRGGPPATSYAFSISFDLSSFLP